MVKNWPLVGIGTMFYMVGAVFMWMHPFERRVIEVREKKTIEKVERIEVPKPSNVKYEPLKNPGDACHGAPVVVESIQINGAQGDENLKDPPSYTWLGVRPAGDEYTVLCYIGGDYSQQWKTGQLISMTGGKITGKE